MNTVFRLWKTRIRPRNFSGHGDKLESWVWLDESFSSSSSAGLGLLRRFRELPEVEEEDRSLTDDSMFMIVPPLFHHIRGAFVPPHVHAKLCGLGSNYNQRVNSNSEAIDLYFNFIRLVRKNHLNKFCIIRDNNGESSTRVIDRPVLSNIDSFEKFFNLVIR